MSEQLRSVVSADFNAVNQFVIDQLYSEVELVESIGHYIVDAGGKRLRPLLVLLIAKACGIKTDKHIPMAAVIEFIHTATLLHDDVVDMSTFQVLVSIGNLSIMEIMANTTNKIAEGEVLQLLAKSNPQPSERDYMRVIENKTAVLFKAAAECGAILADAEAATAEALGRFGMHVGTAFQLIDDVLDYQGEAVAMGKNLGDDLAEGKSTLPLLFAMSHCSADEKVLTQACLTAESPDAEQLQQVIEIVLKSGGIAYTLDKAEQQATRAKACLSLLPDSRYRETLDQMVDFALQRSN